MGIGLNEILADDPAARQRYLLLLRSCLTRSLAAGVRYPMLRRPLFRESPLGWALYPLADSLGWQLTKRESARLRRTGRDWPAEAETMIGEVRLRHLQECVESVIGRGIPGDLMETGVWRGGACILMRGVLKAWGDTDRIVWAADSFEGMPRPDPRYAQDQSDTHWHHNAVLAVSRNDVEAAFAHYGLLDEQVRFLEGWFRFTLPIAPVKRLAVLRLDGDMYGSTMDALEHLYPKLSTGGFLIVDDYGAIRSCRQAVEDYRAKHGIRERVEKIDWTGVFWQKRTGSESDPSGAGSWKLD